MFVARRRTVSYNAGRRKKGSLPVFPCTTADNRWGLRRLQSGIREFSRNRPGSLPKTPGVVRAPRFSSAPDIFSGGFYEGTALRQSQPTSRARLLPLRGLARSRRLGQTEGRRTAGRAAEGGAEDGSAEDGADAAGRRPAEDLRARGH